MKKINKLIAGLSVLALAYQANASKIQLGVEFDGLEPMKGQHYEGWNIVDGKALSTGRFSFAKNGNIYLVDQNGEARMKVGQDNKASFNIDSIHAKAKTFVLTIEPNGDSDENPSNIHVMGGDYEHMNANLEVSHGSSLGTDFSEASGGFILAAPTGGDFNKGVWFIDPSKGARSLNLPELPSGFAYEGWIVNTKNNAKFSTGIFKLVNGADSDGAGPLAGPLKLSFPPVPGQDIVKSHVVLDDGIHAIVISVEPYPDFDPAPFAIKPLMNLISEKAPGMKLLPLNNISENLPKGKVHIH